MGSPPIAVETRTLLPREDSEIETMGELGELYNNTDSALRSRRIEYTHFDVATYRIEVVATPTRSFLTPLGMETLRIIENVFVSTRTSPPFTSIPTTQSSFGMTARHEIRDVEIFTDWDFCFELNAIKRPSLVPTIIYCS